MEQSRYETVPDSKQNIRHWEHNDNTSVLLRERVVSVTFNLYYSKSLGPDQMRRTKLRLQTSKARPLRQTMNLTIQIAQEADVLVVLVDISSSNAKLDV